VPVFPGVYQAKAVKVNRLNVEALIPQVFGEAPVTVQRFMGPPPFTVSTGWVMFVGGNPEFPVWCSGVTTNITNVTTGESGESIYITRDYRWVNTVNAADPGSGKVKVDSYDPEGASEMYISLYDQNDEANLMLLSLTTGDLLAVYLSGDIHTRIEYRLAGPPVNNTGWFTIPLDSNPVNYGFNTSTPSNNAQVKVTVQTVSGGGGGGGDTNEVWIGTNDPIAANPTIELWFDSDDNYTTGLTPTAVAGNALGVVATALPAGSGYVTATNPVGTSYVNCTTPITFTFQTGRRYRITTRFAGANGPAGSGINYMIMDAANALVGDGDLWLSLPNTNYQGGVLATHLDGDGTTKTIRCVVYSVVGSGATVGTYIKSLFIEDLGPNSAPALPIPDIFASFMPLTLTNGFVNSGSPRAPTSYRKVGDIVELRLAVRNGTNNLVIATLPVGFRPPYLLDFMGRDGGGAGVFNIQADGAIVWYGSLANNTIVYLNCSFSVTP